MPRSLVPYNYGGLICLILVDDDMDKFKYMPLGMINNGTLVIEKLTFDDRANYSCYVVNEFGNSTHHVLLRVKGRFSNF